MADEEKNKNQDEEKNKNQDEEKVEVGNPSSLPGQNPWPDKEEWGSKNPPPEEYKWTSTGSHEADKEDLSDEMKEKVDQKKEEEDKD